MQETHGHMLGAGDVVDSYLLEAVLATGTTSTTFRARDQRLDRAVTLKVLHGELFAGVPGAREKAVQEARQAASLEHPNIVPVYGAGEIGDGLWVASRFTDGERLTDAVLTPRRTATLIERVAEAIDAAHALGVVHREIRPEAIVLDRWGNPLVSDYGVTRTSGRTGLATRMELLDGLRYAAPELILGRGATPAADVYGLAATAVRCLTGSHPFGDRPISELVALRTQAPPPVLAAPGVDASALNAALAEGMALDPAARPGSATAFARRLADAVAALPASAGETADAFALDSAAAAPVATPVSHRRPARGATDAVAGDAVVAAPAPAPPPGSVAPPAGATRVERRREPEPEPEPVAQRTPWATIVMLASCVLAIGAAAIGVGGMSGAEPPAPPRTGGFELVPGQVWQPAAVGQAPQLQLGDPVVLSLRPPARALATVGVMTRPGPPGNPLAGEPLRTFAREPAGTLVRVGERTLVRYRGTLSEGGTTTLFVLPTTKGALAAACSERAAEARCAALVATAGLGSARVLAPQPPAAVVTTVEEALHRLETARGVASAKLGSAKEGVPAEGATTLTSDLQEAAQALKLQSGDPGTRAQIERVSRAALDVSLAYEDLSSAMDRQDPVVYAIARRDALAADRALANAVVRLRRAGYRVRVR